MASWLGLCPLVLEVVPPPLRAGDDGIARRLRRVAALHSEVPLSAVNIPEIREEDSKSEDGVRLSAFEPRVEPRELARQIREQLGIRTVINRVVVHLPAAQQRDWFLETHERYGVEDFVLVGGERSATPYPGPTVPEANQLLRETLGERVRIGNICIPTRNSSMPEAERMARKAAAGVDFFTTQIVYHHPHFTDLLGDLRSHADPVVQAPLLLSLCPVRSEQSVSFLRWLGVKIDDSLFARLTCDPEQTLARSLEHLVDLWQQVTRYNSAHPQGQPLGLNIAPVGTIPGWATAELARKLRATPPTQ